MAHTVLTLLVALSLSEASGAPSGEETFARPTRVPQGLEASDWASILDELPPITQQAYVKASNTGEADFLGISVAISKDTVVVGAEHEASNSVGVNGNQGNNGASGAGAAYVFVRNGATWSQQAYLKASNTGADDRFGSSVAVSGNTVVVGAPGESSNSAGVNGNQNNNSAGDAGAAYVFVRNGSTWSQQAYLKASNPGAGDEFGISVSISGSTIIVGAWTEDSNATGVNGMQNNNNATDSGAAYVFVRNDSTWSQQAYLKASNTRSPDEFGNSEFGLSVALSGNTAVVGAPGESSNATGVNGNQNNTSLPFAGATYVFVRNGTGWSQQAYLKASNTGLADNFGGAVAISGDTVLVGAIQEAGIGAAYVFVRDAATWSQQAYLKASNPRASERFGGSVAVDGNTVIVGALGESSNARGVDGNQNDNSASFSGAAYLFVRDGLTWNQRSYLKASNTEQLDQFGTAVAISCGTVIVGAWNEDSNAVGVNGNQSNNNALRAGAAYIFTGAQFGPRLAIARDGSEGYLISANALPECNCQLQRAMNVTGPWTTVSTFTTPLSGVIYHDIAPSPRRRFYRTFQP